MDNDRFFSRVGSSLLFRYAYECAEQGLDVTYVASQAELAANVPTQLTLESKDGEVLNDGKSCDSSVLHSIKMK